MSVRIEVIQYKNKKRVPAKRCEGSLSCELGEVIVDMLPGLLEVQTPLDEISTMLWGKRC
ncbi:MAG: hypothetical protein B6229_05655 [Spirochaetaceae bacterium 4572_7]|nr:MAG: hypothetical protein B6229_05655 [Spirochaetaceae bacterium 4572_7]